MPSVSEVLGEELSVSSVLGEDKPQSVETKLDYPRLYSALPEFNDKLLPHEKDAFSLLGQADGSQESQAAAVNTAYLKNQMPELSQDDFLTNYPNIREGFAKNNARKMSYDTDLAFFHSLKSQSDAEVVDGIRNPVWQDTYYNYRHMFSEGATNFINAIYQPFSKYTTGEGLSQIGEAANYIHTNFTGVNAVTLPDIRGLMDKNPQLLGASIALIGQTNTSLALAGYGAVKPVAESLTSPEGVVLIGAFGGLSAMKEAGSVAAGRILMGMNVGFTGLMGYASYELMGETMRVMDDPKSTFDDKAAAVANQMMTNFLTLAASFGVVSELLPKKTTAVVEGKPSVAPASTVLAEKLKGKTLEEAKIILDDIPRISPELEVAIDTARKDIDMVTGVETTKPTIRAAVKIQEDGTYLEGISHDLIAGEGVEAFITSTGEVLSRDDALIVAKESGTLKPEFKDKTELYSEMVEMKADPIEVVDPVKQTSLKNATAEMERNGYGMAESNATETTNLAESWIRSGTAIAEDPGIGARILKELADNPDIGLTVDQSNILLRHKNGIKNALDETMSLAHNELVSLEVRDAANLRAAELSQELLTFMDIVRERGTSWGREGRVRQALTKEDYSYSTQENLHRVANGGKELTEVQKSKLIKQIDDLKAKQSLLDAEILRLTESRSREAVVTKAIDDIIKPAVKQKFQTATRLSERLTKKADESRKFLSGKLLSPTPEDFYHMSVIAADHMFKIGLDSVKWTDAMVKDLGDNIRPHLDKLWEMGQKEMRIENKATLIDNLKAKIGIEPNYSVANTAQKLARQFVEEGVVEREALVKAVHTELKSVVPEITEREAMDAISGYGKYSKLSEDQVSLIVRDLKGQMQQIGKLEDMEAGVAPKKTGIQRRVTSEEEKALIKEVQAKKKEGGFVIKDAQKELKSRIQSIETSLENQIKSLTKEFETGVKPEAGKPAPTNLQIEKLKSLKEEIKITLSEIEDKPTLSNEQKLQKINDSIDRSILKLESDLQEGKIRPDKKQASEISSKEIEAKKSYLEELKNFRQELRDLENPPKSPKELYLERRKQSFKDQIASLEEQIKSREKTVKNKKTFELDEEAQILKDKRDQLKEQYDEVFGRKELTDEQRLNIIKNRDNARLLEYNDIIARKDFAVKEKRKAVALDRAALETKSLVERAKQEIIRGRQEMLEAAMPAWQRGFQKTSDIARAGAISGYHTLGKLAGYSLARLTSKPLTEGLGMIIERMPGVKQYIVPKANLETGASIQKLAQFYTDFGTKGMKEAYETLKTGKGAVESELGNIRYTGKKIYWYDYFGISHSAEKAPLRIAEFEMVLQKANEFSLNNGIEMDAMTQAANRKMAHDYANREILQEKNAFSQWINKGLRDMESIDPITGNVSSAKFVMSNLIKTFITKGIVKTPSNYLMQTIEGSPAGLLYGLGRAGKSIIQKGEGLSSKEANAILRLMKNGGIGTGMYAWGAADAALPAKERTFGGYYQPGEKRDPDDVKFGCVRIFGVNIPIHAPFIETAQMASTMMRVSKSKLKKKDKEERGLIEGTVASVLSLVETAPLVNPITRLAGKVSRNQTDQVVADEIAGMVPAIVDNIARDLDVSPTGEKIKRKATNVTEAIQAKIPGLREDLPETKAKKDPFYRIK